MKSTAPAVTAERPANIALIKYMGKIAGASRNKPTNASFSFTLDRFLSRVTLSPLEAEQDRWAPLQENEWQAPTLSADGQARFLNHFQFLKTAWKISGAFLVQSANNFASDCGIASSASSFAALTAATYKLAQAQNPELDLSLNQVAEFSRQGSGSSIRSFFSPFVLWNEHGVSSVEVPEAGWLHRVVLVDTEKKSVSSSEAHKRVATSLLFQGRPERAEQRLRDLLTALKARDWVMAYEITWAEFVDMHALFATAQPHFQYMTPASVAVLDTVQEFWRERKDGPLVTMDAGANVHLLFRADQGPAIADLEGRLNGLGRIAGGGLP